MVEEHYPNVIHTDAVALTAAAYTRTPRQTGSLVLIAGCGSVFTNKKLGFREVKQLLYTTRRTDLKTTAV